MSTRQKIEVKDKTHIKQLLYAECVLGITYKGLRVI